MLWSIIPRNKHIQMIYLFYSSAEAEFAGDAPAACASATGAPTVRSSTAGTGGNEMEKKNNN